MNYYSSGITSYGKTRSNPMYQVLGTETSIYTLDFIKRREEREKKLED